MNKKIKREAEFEALYLRARKAGLEAGTSAGVTPMIVGSPTTPLGSDIDRNKPVYVVPDGPCGFAWVNIKPANSAFAKWLIRSDIARIDGYAGGATVSCRDFNQSMARKEAYCYAFSKVLSDAGIRNYASSRMD